MRRGKTEKWFERERESGGGGGGREKEGGGGRCWRGEQEQVGKFEPTSPFTKTHDHMLPKLFVKSDLYLT